MCRKPGCLTGDHLTCEVCARLSCKEGSKPATVLNFHRRCPHTEPPLKSDEALMVSSHFLLPRRDISETVLSTALYTCLVTGLLFTDKNHMTVTFKTGFVLSVKREAGHPLPVMTVWAAHGSLPGQLPQGRGET